MAEALRLTMAEETATEGSPLAVEVDDATKEAVANKAIGELDRAIAAQSERYMVIAFKDRPVEIVWIERSGAVVREEAIEFVQGRRMPRQKPGQSKQDYATPDEFIRRAKKVLRIGAFTFDFAADASNTKAKRFWSRADDSLSKSPEEWAKATRGGWGWLNPEFADIEPWARRCYQTKMAGGKVALLVPAAVGANWYKRYVHGKALVIQLNGRLGFIEGRPKELYPKDCILCLYDPKIRAGHKVWTWRTEIQLK